MPDARIVDRPEWIRAATESMRVMTGGTDETATGSGASSRAGSPARRPARCWRSSRRASSASTTRSAGDGGELLLVYPNVIAVERQLRVHARRLPAVGVPARGHPPGAVHARIRGWPNTCRSALAVLTAGHRRGRRRGGRPAGRVRPQIAATASRPEPNSAGILGVLRAVQSEPQREALDQLLVLGTLLEGHADHVMDAVGPAVVPSVATIRRRFDDGGSASSRRCSGCCARCSGIDAKMSQYTRGKAFVDHVVGRVGMDRFNAIWSGPKHCRCPTEIEEPQRWIDRVL